MVKTDARNESTLLRPVWLIEDLRSLTSKEISFAIANVKDLLPQKADTDTYRASSVLAILPS